MIGMSNKITIVRHVAVWYYLLTGLTALGVLGWLAHRRLLSLGIRLLAGGIAVNALWEGLLFTVWGRRYETIVSIPVQAGYHSLTEFGPPLVVSVLLLDHVGAINLSAWRESEQTIFHRTVRLGATSTIVVSVLLCLSLAVVRPAVLSTPITIYRDVSWSYFAVAAGTALVVLGAAVWRRDRVALALFVVLGVFNVLFEIVGLVGGYRSYYGLSSFASVFVGLTESGSAAALVWMLVKMSVPQSFNSTVAPS
jgi:hypothetical protein